ncbi:hypothetical protein BX600DRAFT_440167 [Xylariales sp. PMI_506]|nr:hypothetical protein BX600DRAFT_440167 [Xylariales sp. PMI_506]
MTTFSLERAEALIRARKAENENSALQERLKEANREREKFEQESEQANRNVDELSQKLAEAKERARNEAEIASRAAEEMSRKFLGEKEALVAQIATLEQEKLALESQLADEAKKAEDAEAAKVAAQECAEKAEDAKKKAVKLARKEEQLRAASVHKAEEAQNTATEALDRANTAEKARGEAEKLVAEIQKNQTEAQKRVQELSAEIERMKNTAVSTVAHVEEAGQPDATESVITVRAQKNTPRPERDPKRKVDSGQTLVVPAGKRPKVSIDQQDPPNPGIKDLTKHLRTAVEDWDTKESKRLMRFGFIGQTFVIQHLHDRRRDRAGFNVFHCVMDDKEPTISDLQMLSIAENYEEGTWPLTSQLP